MQNADRHGVGALGQRRRSFTVGLGGEGVGFADGAALHSGAAAASANLVVSPPSGPSAGGTPVQISTSFINGSAPFSAMFASSIVATQSSGTAPLTAVTPPGSGIVDVALVDFVGAEVLGPEAFSYGPNVIENTTSYVTADGGGLVTLYGAGFESRTNAAPPDLSITVGGQPVAISAFAGAGNFFMSTPYLQFAAPAGAAGTKSDIVVSTQEGRTTLKNALTYLAAPQVFPLPGASLYQGVYDPHRDLYYFTDQTKIQVFSRTQGKWLAPLNMPAGASRLWGLSLSPDGAKLAVADEGAQAIYVLDPANPLGAKTFSFVTSYGPGMVPCGVSVTDHGLVYIIATDLYGDGAPNVYRLDPTTGNLGYYHGPANGTPGDCQVRTIASRDGAHVYFNDEGELYSIDTTLFYAVGVPQGDDELALSSDQTSLASSEYLVNTNFGVQSYVTENEREASASGVVYGQKLSPDGSLLFQPLTGGLDLIDGRTGVWNGRIGLPFSLAGNYDALVADQTSNTLVAITGTGDGVAVISLAAIPIPNPLPYARLVPAGSPAGRLWVPFRRLNPAERKHQGTGTRFSSPHAVHSRARY